MLEVIDATHQPEDTLREHLHRGAVVVSDPSAASLALARHAQSLLDVAYPETAPRIAQHMLSSTDWFQRLAPIRNALRTDAHVWSLVRAVLQSNGVDLEHTFVDAVRLRAVASGGHDEPLAAPVYFPHRDTWFANPAAQINWWLPLHDVTTVNTLAFFPAYSHNLVRNDSHAFDYDAFVTMGGFQAPSEHKVHPQPLEPLLSDRVALPLQQAQILRFSATLLHATQPHRHGCTRWSLDFRTVHRHDLLRYKHTRRLDSRAQGTTLTDFRNALTLEPVGMHTVATLLCG